ncbi:MAG: hypothetical protein WDZ94_04030 [Patescibacteria group bacterium]
MNKIHRIVLAVLLIFSGLFLNNSVSNAAETAPNVNGRVRHVDGITPITSFGNANIWLDWEVLDNLQDTAAQRKEQNPDGRRFVRTSSDGSYTFPHYNPTDGENKSIWETASDSYTSKNLNELLDLARNQSDRYKRMRYEYQASHWYKYGCHQNSHMLSVVTPNSVSGQGVFIASDGVPSSTNHYTTDLPQSYQFDMPNGSNSLEFNFKWLPTGQTPVCPETLPVRCNPQVRDAEGNIQATISWNHPAYSTAASGEENDVTQFLVRVHNTALTWANDLNYLVDPMYSGGDTNLLNGNNRNIMVRSNLTSIPLFVTPGQEYNWSVQPGKRDWPAPHGSLWNNAPYQSPNNCFGVAIRCNEPTTDPDSDSEGETSQGEMHTLSCANYEGGQSSAINYHHRINIDADSTFLDTFTTGQLVLEFSAPSDSQLAGVIDGFFGNQVLSQSTVNGNTVTRVSLINLGREDFKQSWREWSVASIQIPDTHQFSNGQTISDLDTQLLAAGIDSVLQNTRVIFLNNSQNSEGVFVHARPLEMACQTSTGGVPAACPDPNSYSITLDNPTQVVDRDNPNFLVNWNSSPSQLSGVTNYEALLFNNQQTNIDQAYASPNALIKKTPDESTKQALFSIDDINDLNDHEIGVAIRPLAGAQTCPWTRNTLTLQEEVDVNFRVKEPDTACIPTDSHQLISNGLLGNSTINGEPIADNPMTLNFDYNSNNNRITTNFINTDYSCASMCSRTNCNPLIDSDEQEIDILVHTGQIYSSWWQTRGGLVFAQQQIRSNLPLLSEVLNPRCNDLESCVPFIIRTDRFSPTQRREVNRTAGILMTDGELQNTALDGSSVKGWATQRQRNQYAEGASAHIESNYRYSDFRTLVSPPNATAKASISSSDITSQQVSHWSGEVEIPNPIQIEPGGQHIVFVDGNLSINAVSEGQKMITVPNGSFLAFIVNGNITFNGLVGSSDFESEDPLVEGIFMAEESIVINSLGAGNDLKFIGAGSFIGWTNVSMNRNYNDVDKPEEEQFNDLYATELFIHRPDLVISTPEILREASVTWQEVN